jgi:hypothetical protein
MLNRGVSNSPVFHPAVPGPPPLALVLAGITPAVRVSQRLDDGNLQARRVQGNGMITGRSR